MTGPSLPEAPRTGPWRDLDFQRRLVKRYREHAAAEPVAPDWNSPEARGFDYAAHREAVARWEGGIEYFARALAEQLELNLQGSERGGRHDHVY